MSWYQPEDLQIIFRDSIDSPEGVLGDLFFHEKLKLFFWNRLLPTFLRRRLVGSRLHGWVVRA